MVMNLAIGSFTPPLGTVMFTASAVSEVSIIRFLKESWGLYIVLFIVLMIVTYVPSLSLLLTN